MSSKSTALTRVQQDAAAIVAAAAAAISEDDSDDELVDNLLETSLDMSGGSKKSPSVETMSASKVKNLMGGRWEQDGPKRGVQLSNNGSNTSFTINVQNEIANYKVSNL